MADERKVTINKPKKKRKYRWVCPDWLARILPEGVVAKLPTRASVQKTNKMQAAAPAKNEAPQQARPVSPNTESVPRMQPSEKTMRLAALEYENLGNTMRMVDATGRVVTLNSGKHPIAQPVRNENEPPMQQTASMPVQQNRQMDMLEDMSILHPQKHRNAFLLRMQQNRLKKQDKRNDKYVSREKKAQQKRTVRNRRAWISAGVACALIALVTGGAIAAWHYELFDESIRYVEVTQVYFDGIPVGAVEDGEKLQQNVDALYEELSVQYGVDVLANQELVLQDALVDPRYVSSVDEVTREVKRNIGINVNATVITIDGMVGAVLESKEDAQWVLDQALAPYLGGDGDIEVGFLEDVKIEQQEVDYSLVRSREDAFQFLTVGVDAAQVYTVKSGDTLWSISDHFGYTIAEIRQANPALANSDDLYVGMELSLMSPQRLLNVSGVQVIKENVAIPHETETTEDDSMYTDQKVVTQEGSDGEKIVTTQINYVNGMEASRTVLSEEIVTEPVTERVTVGTKKRPSNVSAAGYMRPVTGGRVTSPFGPRRAPTAGASTYHRGVDIGVGYGTPIMATRDGTVTYAGWNGGYGYMVEVDHGGGVRSRYAHCSS
ncbi:MAG: M23 family metallopeptidase, partial [Clostridia bacterium]|nr:M23 family metallopeptidase [Clostridia bacterium]